MQDIQWRNCGLFMICIDMLHAVLDDAERSSTNGCTVPEWENLATGRTQKPTPLNTGQSTQASKPASTQREKPCLPPNRGPTLEASPQSHTTSAPQTLAQFRGHAAFFLRCKNWSRKNPAVLRPHLNLGRTLLYRPNFDASTHMDVETKCQKKTMFSYVFKTDSETLASQYGAFKTQHCLNYIFAEFIDRKSIASINEDPVRHQRKKKLTGAEPSKGTSQPHRLRYVRLTRIHCRMLGLVLVPHHVSIFNHFPWQRCKGQCSKCGVVVVQTEMVW